MDLFINTAALDLRRALVTSLTDAGEATLAPLAFGDTIDLTVYLVDGKGGYHADAGSASLTPTLSLGPKNDASLVTSPSFTAASGDSSKGFAASLALTADALALFLGAVHGPLYLTLSTVKAGKRTTWLTQEVEITGSIV